MEAFNLDPVALQKYLNRRLPHTLQQFETIFVHVVSFTHTSLQTSTVTYSTRLRHTIYMKYICEKTESVRRKRFFNYTFMFLTISVRDCVRRRRQAKVVKMSIGYRLW